MRRKKMVRPWSAQNMEWEGVLQGLCLCLSPDGGEEGNDGDDDGGDDDDDDDADAPEWLRGGVAGGLPALLETSCSVGSAVGTAC